jgi:hypothetical protein
MILRRQFLPSRKWREINLPLFEFEMGSESVTDGLMRFFRKGT